MFEELVETAVGPVGIAAVLLLGTRKGRELMRTAFKESVKFGVVAGERMRDAYAELQEEAADAIAEAHSEKPTSHKKSRAAHTNAQHE